MSLLSEIIAPTSLLTTNNTKTVLNKTLVDPIITLQASEGATGQVAISQGTGVSPIWYTPVSTTTVTGTTHNATATFGTVCVLCDTTSNTVTVNLPTAVGNTALYEIKKIATANSMIIDGLSTETIDGSATVTVVVENESLTLVSDNTNWKVI